MLICELRDAGIPTCIIKIISSFLTDRKFRVKIGNDYSTKKSVAAGVLQGSILGQVLYILFNNNISTYKNTKSALFVDDTAIYSHSWKKAKALDNVQRHSKVLKEYYEGRKIKINAIKTDCVIFHRKKDRAPEDIHVFGTNVNLT